MLREVKQFLQKPFSQDFDSELKLRRVRIYFYTTTFDRITKDRAAKFVDMLSAIGGTMGLLTGFLIISGVEILYYAVNSQDHPSNSKKTFCWKILKQNHKDDLLSAFFSLNI